MAFPLRLEFPGALYRVTSRGNARQKIFRDDEAFLGLAESGIAILTICVAGTCANDAFSLFILYVVADRRTMRYESRLVLILRSFRKQQLAFNPF